MTTKEKLTNLFRQFQVDGLVGITTQAFQQELMHHLSNHAYPQYTDPTKQRDQAIRFQWGHNHDFGLFQLNGAMGLRHIDLIAHFVDVYGLPLNFKNQNVLDIGCWTGGTSLMLAAMGAKVLAIEEVEKYVAAARFLAESFGVTDRLEFRQASICDPDLADRYSGNFQYVIYAGVLYHVTDPVLSLRVAYSCLAENRSCYLETAGLEDRGCILRYEGPSRFVDSRDRGIYRRGWNWFIPSIGTIERMALDVGFTGHNLRFGGGRVVGTLNKSVYTDMMRAGLSRGEVL